MVQFGTSLNNPTQPDYGLPDYSAAISGTKPFTAPTDGWVNIYLHTNRNLTTSNITYPANLSAMMIGVGNGEGDVSGWIPAPKGTIINTGVTSFCPCLGK